MGNVNTSIVDVRVFVEGTGGVTGTGAVNLITIQDEVGNQLQSNQANGRTELTIFVGSGFDYGDAPAPYTSLDVDGGPRHAVDPTFSFGPTVSADPNAIIPDGDDDDGMTIPAALQAGFSTSMQVNINNTNGRTFYVDAWFDWNANGLFESSEVLRFGSPGTNRSVMSTGTNSILVAVPASAQLGETYARFRLSESATTGPIGNASSGEVEDYRILITNNPFQNPAGQYDSNNSGAVTPLDALQIINALTRADTGSINLSIPDLPAGLPPFPDVDGNGFLTSFDAFLVINELQRLANTGGTGELIGGEGEAISSGFLPVASGVLASGATALGDRLIAEATLGEASTIKSPAVTKASVFDTPAVVQLDSIVDSLAKDAVAAKDSENAAETVDRLFAEL